MRYVVKQAKTAAGPEDSWSGGCWAGADTIEVSHFHPNSTDHRPPTRAKMLYDEEHLYVLFHVRDRFVRCVHTTYQSRVCRDSCVEFFLQPDPQRGYFNFELNCGGTMLLYYIEDARPSEDAPFRKFTPVPESLVGGIRIWHSLPQRVEPEIDQPLEWTLGCAVPLAFFESFLKIDRPLAGSEWRGNFFKCGDQTSHPHWASWSPIGDMLRFHQPDRFGTIRFEG